MVILRRTSRLQRQLPETRAPYLESKGAPYYLPEQWSSDAELVKLEARLEETPCYAGRGFEKVIFPRVKTEELLRQRWSAG